MESYILKLNHIVLQGWENAILKSTIQMCKGMLKSYVPTETKNFQPECKTNDRVGTWEDITPYIVCASLTV